MSISFLNLICLLGAVLFMHGGTSFSGFGVSIFFGYFANLTAITVGVVTGAMIGIRAAHGDGRAAWNRHWLGILNAFAVVLAWVPVFLPTR